LSPSKLKLGLDPRLELERFFAGAEPSETPGREEVRAVKRGEKPPNVDPLDEDRLEDTLNIEEADEVESTEVFESCRADREGRFRLLDDLTGTGSMWENSIELLRLLGVNTRGEGLTSRGSSIRGRSTPCSSLMRLAIQRDVLGSRISSLYSARDSKYSSTRPLLKVPKIAGPIA
jgi:hypothetical protein